MLHIIFLILKILGIVLAVLVGIILFILIVTLFVPIRYQLLGKKEDEVLFLDTKATWLLHLVMISLSYIDEKLWIRLRIAGIVFYDNRKMKKDNNKESDFKEDEVTEEKHKEHAYDAKESQKVTIKDAIDTEKDFKISEQKITSIKEDIKKNNTDSDVTIELDDREEVNPVKKLGTSLDSESEKLTDYKKQEIDILKENKNKSDKASKYADITDEKKKRKIKFNIKEIFRKMKQVYYRVLSFFKSLKAKIKKIKELIIDLLHKKNLILDFLKDEQNKLGLKKVWISIRGVLKHIAPKKIQGTVHFGTGDPCTTGQALGAIAVFYGIYGDKISIRPDFEEEVLNGELFLKGRIRLINLLIIAIKLIRDKYFSQLIKNAKQLKEEL